MPMRRRSFVGSAGAVALAAALPATARQGKPAGGSGDARFRTLLDKIFEDRLTENPEGATSLGLDTGKNAALKSQLSGRSPTDVARPLARSSTCTSARSPSESTSAAKSAC